MSSGADRVTAWIELTLEDAEEGTVLYNLAENLEYLNEHVDEWEDGGVEPGDLPNFDPHVQSVILRSVWFGTLWELAHPSIFVVLDGDHHFVGVYGIEENAEERAAEISGTYHRQSVADCDKPPEAIHE